MDHTPSPPAASDEVDLLAFTPVPDNGRYDGWTARKQRDFIAMLAIAGVVARACRAVGMSRQSAYKLRERPDAQEFAHAWDIALQMGYDRMLEIVMDRALNGVTTPRYYKGRQIGTITRPDIRLMMAALAAPPPPLPAKRRDQPPRQR